MRLPRPLIPRSGEADGLGTATVASLEGEGRSGNDLVLDDDRLVGRDGLVSARGRGNGLLGRGGVDALAIIVTMVALD